MNDREALPDIDIAVDRLSIGAAVIIDGVHDIPPIFDEIGENDRRTPYGVCFGWSISILHGITMAQLPGIGN